MRITIPKYFDDNGSFSSLKLDNATAIEYKIYQKHSRLEVALTSDLLIFVRRGQKIISTGHTVTTLDTGKAIFLRRGNYIMNQIIGLEDNCFESVLLFLDDGIKQDFITHYQSLFSNANLPNTIDRQAYFEIDTNPLILTTIESMLPYFSQPQNQISHILKLKIYELLLNIMNTNSCDFLKYFLLDIDSADAQDIAAIVDKHYCEQLAIEDYARLTNRSLSTFKRDFTKLFAMPPKKWITAKRLEKAYFLITNSNQSITEICFLSGFNHVSHFVLLFREKYGITPKKLQAQVRTMPAKEA